MEHSAYREAVTCFEQALEALAYLPEQRDTREQAIDLRLDLRHALLPIGAHARILETLQEATILAEAIDDSRRLGWVSAHMSHAFNGEQVNYDQAIACGHRALELAKPLGDTKLQAIACFRLGQAYRTASDFRQAIDYHRQVVAFLQGDLLYERFGTASPISVLSRSQLAGALAEMGSFAEGATYGKEALSMAEAVNSPFGCVVALMHVARLSLLKGDVDRAIGMTERAIALSQEANITLASLSNIVALAYAFARAGRLTESAQMLEQDFEHLSQTGARYRMPWVVNLSDAFLLTGRLQDASTHAKDMFEVSLQRGARGYQAYAHRVLAEIAMHRDPPDVDQAETHYQQALSLADELGMRPLQAHCHRGLGTLYRQTGQSEQARAELSMALEMYHDMEMTFWLPEAEAALAELEGTP
jgi:tetratricopeptide (TPR) repeat protein